MTGSASIAAPKPQAPSREAPMSVRSLSMAFGGIQALTDVSFDVLPTGFTALIGPNGAGKTTVFNCVSGFYRGEGSIHACGVRLDPLPRHARAALGVARTFQTPTLVDDDTVIENVLAGRYARTRAGLAATFLGLPRVGREEREARHVVEDLLERLDIAEFAHRVTAGLPHRLRRTVEIARALASEPRVLLMDEPAAGSHHSEAVMMLDNVRSICAERGVAVLLVEHNVPLVMEFAQHVIVLDFGKVLAQGAPEVVQRDERVIEAYLGQGVV
jgi:branched-chain amino acid transport system ATP-binding protein